MNEKRITNIDINNILPNRMQPRIVFQDENIDELADSISKHGILNPIIVRRLGDKFEIIAGERRYKASKSLDLKEVPAIIIEADDKKAAELALIENIQRKELSPIEEAISYEKILQIGDLTQSELSRQLGKKQSTIANKIRLLKLDEEVKEALLNNKISERHARSLLRLYDKNDQKLMLNRIINERLTVRQSDKEIEKIIEEKGEIVEMDKNIPNTNLIVDQKEENITNPGEVVNPSFVDVNEIEKKSEEIFKEKPVVNIEDLLKPSTGANVNVTVEPEKKEFEIEESNTEEQKEQPVQHKFFNIFPDEETSQDESNQQMNFNIKDVEINEPQKSTLETIDELPEMKIDQIEEPTSLTIPEEIPNPENKMEEPEFDFDNFNPIIHNDFAGEEINEEEVEFFEEDDEPVANEIPYEPKQIRDVIKIIRDCNDIIESYGYRIETEEFDLETMYQVIFKIYKD